MKKRAVAVCLIPHPAEAWKVAGGPWVWPAVKAAEEAAEPFGLALEARSLGVLSECDLLR